MGIDQYAYLSPLRNTHPGEKILLAVLTMVVVLALDSLLISGLVFIFLSGLILGAGKVPGRIYFNLLLVPLLFLLVGCAGVALVVLSHPGDLVVAFPVGAYWLGVSGESLQAALRVFGRCLACIACMYFLALTTPMTQIIQVLKKTRLPVAFTEVMGLIYGSIFGLMGTAAEISLAQKSRCGYNNFTASMRSVSTNSFQLLIRYLHKSHQSYQALVARGFSGNLPVLEEPFRWKTNHIIFIIGFNLLLVIIKITG